MTLLADGVRPSAEIVLAHGVGGGSDLPIPAFYAYAGAALALLVSFVALGMLWDVSRLRGGAAGVAIPVRLIDARPVRNLLRVLGLAAWLLTIGWLVLGPDDPASNPGPLLFYVVLWVGLVPASLLLGPVWRLLNPLRTLHALLPARTPRRLPPAVGYWPAAVGLVAFAWVELVAPAGADPDTVLAFVLGYSAVQLVAAWIFGAQWFTRGDAFEVFSSLIGALAVIGRRDDGQIVVRNPLDGLDAVRAAPGLVATTCVLLATTGYDGLSGSQWWARRAYESGLDTVAYATLALLATILAVVVLYAGCVGAAGLIAGRRHVVAAFAHSLIPIAVGYLIAHYVSLLAAEGPRGVVLALTGRDPGPYALLDVETVALVQVLAIIVGHMVGVVAAHDRSVRLFPRDRAVAAQIPLLVLMVCYTLGGLTLLFTR